MPESMYHQIHFAWAEPTLLGRVGPGPASSSLPETEQPVLRSWRDRLIPALTADYRSALPDTDPADYPETLWAHTYPDGQAALVYRWPGDVRSAHAWAIVGPGYGLTLPRVLALHENPNTRPAQRRPPAPGWAAMDTLPAPEPWERTAAPGAVRTRDRHAAETAVGGEPLLVGAVAAALARPDLPVHIALAPERADLWQAVQLRFLWGMHRALHDVLTPPRAIPAAGWSWSFSTYDPVLGTADGRHLAFGPPAAPAATPFLNPPPPDHRRTAEALVAVLREEGGDALAAHLAERGIPEAPTFADRRDLLADWLAPSPRPSRTVPAEAPQAVPLPPCDAGVGAASPEPAEGIEAHRAPESAPPRGFGEEAPESPAETRAPGYGDLDDDLGLEDVPEAEALPDGEPEPGSGDGLTGAPDADADRGSDGDRCSARDRHPGGDRAPHGGRGSAGDRAPAGGGSFDTASEQDDIPLPDLPEAEAPGEEETGPRPPSEPWAPAERTEAARPAPGARLGQGSLRAFAEEIARAADAEREAGRARSAAGSGRDPDGNAPQGRTNEALWPSSDPEPLPEAPEPVDGPDGAAEAPPRARMPRIAPAPGEPSTSGALRTGEADGGEPQGGHRRTTGIFDAPEPYAQHGPVPARDPLAPPAYYEAGEIVTDDPTPVAGRPRMFGRTLRRAVDRDARAAQRRAAERREAEEAALAPGAGEAPEVPEATETQEPPAWREPHERTVAVPPAERRDLPADAPPEDFAPPAPLEPVAAPELRAPADAPPLGVVAAADGENGNRGGNEPLDYAAETEPGFDDPFDEGPADDNWPTQYADLPLARLERWHSRRGPEGARVDVVDARAAVRAERAELQRVREERDHYHAEVQDLRRDVARLDRPWLDPEDEEEHDAPLAPRTRRRLPRVLVPILLVAFLATGLEAGARLDLGALDLLALLGDGIASLFG
ncbi:hypothetical protein [Nocardiopsis sp. NPDC055824]